jgi:hypothetical protein
VGPIGPAAVHSEEVNVTSRRTATLTCIAAAAMASACADPVEPTEALTVVPGASVVLKVPTHSPGPPFYAIIANGAFLPHDGDWAAVPFVRELACVPADVNLLAIVGPPAFGCTLTVEGHEHWQNGPGLDPAPRQTIYTGLGAVPIVFVHLAEVQAAMADGVLTLPELLGLPSVIPGTADVYRETDILGVSGPLGPGRGMYKIMARGTLSTGPSFDLMVNEVLGQLQVVRITFGP